ncbi:hypothetical protein O181_014501 [Austropuccinia psidii MF-1]|uniref:Uncharacterized protein n=1 Tax=Austropuccinia psidii MF-1 TaxID=1389203 RepID=A0A9Q3C1U8_9BASI|nr:hypothetical protein [Austropuccinia psidii MF-1]
MPVQNSPPARKTRSQARTQAVLTPTPRVHLDGTLADSQGPLSKVLVKMLKRRRRILWKRKSLKSKPSLWAIMHQMTPIMPNLQAASSSQEQRPPDFKTPYMKAPKFFDGALPFNFRSLIQSCQLIFHNDLANFSQDRKKALDAT